MKNLLFLFSVLILILSCNSDDEGQITVCNPTFLPEFRNTINLPETREFKFHTKTIFAQTSEGLLFQTEGELNNSIDSLFLIDANSGEIIRKIEPANYTQTDLPLIVDDVLHWEYLKLHSFNLQTYEKSNPVENDDVGDFFFLKNNHLLYNVYSGFSAGEISIIKKNLADDSEEVIYTENYENAGLIYERITNLYEWEDENGDGYVSFFTRMGNEFPYHDYFFITISLSDNSLLVKRPFAKIGSINPRFLVYKENLVFCTEKYDPTLIENIFCINPKTGDINWELTAGLGHLEQVENNYEQTGKHILVRLHFDLAILETDTGTEIYRLPKHGENLNFPYLKGNVILLEYKNEIFYRWENDFYGYNFKENCEILHLPAADFPETFQNVSFDFVNQQFVFAGNTKIMFLPYE